jgi:hypothetical protein
MQRHDIAKTSRGERDKTEVDQVAGERRSILEPYAGKRAGNAETDDGVQRDECCSDEQIEQDRTKDAMTIDPPRSEHGPGHDPTRRKPEGDPCRRVAVEGQARVLDPQNRRQQGQRDREQHPKDGKQTSRNDEEGGRGHGYQRQPDAVRPDDSIRLQRRDDEQHQRQKNRKRRQ